MKKQSVFQEFIKPVLVLLLICVAVSAALAFVNSKTAPVIAENERIAAEKNRKKAMPEAASFSENLVGEHAGFQQEFPRITGIYAAADGEGRKTGYVFTAEQNGYGGPVRVTVGIGVSGDVKNVVADVSTETQGVGTKAGKAGYLGLFTGLTDEERAKDTDTLTGATRSSSAVRDCVADALRAYRMLENETAGGEGEP